MSDYLKDMFIEVREKPEKSVNAIDDVINEVMDFIKNTEDKKLKNKLALNMFKAWYVTFYEYGVIHGDPHLGNYTIMNNANLNLLDFGCIRIFKPKFVTGVIDLYSALKNNDYKIPGTENESSGFENPTNHIKQKKKKRQRFE